MWVLGSYCESVSLRVKQDETKKRQHQAAMGKADNVSLRLKTKMKAWKKEEGQLRWKRHKPSRQMEVEKEEALDAMKSERCQVRGEEI